MTSFHISNPDDDFLRESTFNLKSNTVHTHTIPNIISLQLQLDEKASKGSVSTLLSGSLTTGPWEVQFTPADNAWQAIVWSPELGLFCAVSSTGTANRAMTSPDGAVWTARTTPDNAWQGIAWSPELGLFCAVCNDGVVNSVMTSPDGIVWTAQTAINNNWKTIIWSSELGIFCALAEAGANCVMTSPDGITWTNYNAPVSTWIDIVWAPELSLFCAISSTAVLPCLMTSPDGITWTIRNAAVVNSWAAIEWSPKLGLFAAVGITGIGNRVMTSPDGIVWTVRASAFDNDWAGIVWSPELGIFCATSISVPNVDSIMVSSDGINWYTQYASVAANYNSIAWSPELATFSSVAYSGTGNRALRSIATSQAVTMPFGAKRIEEKIFYAPIEFATAASGTTQLLMDRPSLSLASIIPVSSPYAAKIPAGCVIIEAQVTNNGTTITTTGASTYNIGSGAPAVNNSNIFAALTLANANNYGWAKPTPAGFGVGITGANDAVRNGANIYVNVTTIGFNNLTGDLCLRLVYVY